ncbi:hypothetical protein [Streptomyces cyaneofuscatus]
MAPSRPTGTGASFSVHAAPRHCPADVYGFSWQRPRKEAAGPG